MTSYANTLYGILNLILDYHVIILLIHHYMYYVLVYKFAGCNINRERRRSERLLERQSSSGPLYHYFLVQLDELFFTSISLNIGRQIVG